MHTRMAVFCHSQAGHRPPSCRNGSRQRISTCHFSQTVAAPTACGLSASSKMKFREQDTDIQVSGFIAENFRMVPLFLTHNHPGWFEIGSESIQLIADDTPTMAPPAV